MKAFTGRFLGVFVGAILSFSPKTYLCKTRKGYPVVVGMTVVAGMTVVVGLTLAICRLLDVTIYPPSSLISVEIFSDSTGDSVAIGFAQERVRI